MNVNALGLPVIDDAVIAFVFFLAVCFTLIWRFWDRVEYDEWKLNYDDEEREFDERDEQNVYGEWRMNYDDEERAFDGDGEHDER